MNRIYLTQMERFISFLKKLNSQDLFELENGDAKIKFIMEHTIKESRNVDDYSSFILKLLNCRTREECEIIFEVEKFTKSTLESILKSLGVSFTKKDTKQKLQSKIIENTLGSRLRSEAILKK